MTIELRTLGDCQIVIGQETLGPTAPMAFGLALYLATERGRPHSRDELLALLMAEDADGKAAHNLRQAVHKLREMGMPIDTTPAGYMVAAPAVRDDYSALLASGDLPDLAGGRLPGGFLPGYSPPTAAFTRWLEERRDEVNSALRRAYLRKVQDRRAVARWDEVERCARLCLGLDPLNESATVALAEALAMSGSKVEGAKVLDQYVQEVGQGDPALTSAAAAMRRRIAERAPSATSKRIYPHIGRENELRDLARLFADARAGIPKSVAIIGEPGIGKTRLANEFLSTLRLQDARILEACCQPHDAWRPMSILVDLVPHLLAIRGAKDAAMESIAVLQSIHRVDESGALTSPDIPSSTPEAFAALLTDSLSDVIDGVSQTRPLVLWVEDVHWADTLSIQVLAHLAKENKRRHLLTVVTARSLPPALSQSVTVVVPLRGLAPHECKALVCSQLHGTLNNDASVVEQITSLARGNPFFIRTLSDRYIERRTLDGVPPELRDVIAQRISCLTPAERTALTACAALGRLSTVTRLEALLELPRHALADTLATLEAMGLVEPHDGRIETQHELISRVIFDTEPSTRLAVLRQSAAELLEREAAESGEIAHFWTAADLWLDSGEPERAKAALRTCALHAARVGAANESFDAVVRYSEVATEAEAISLCESIRIQVALNQRAALALAENWKRHRVHAGKPVLTRYFDLLTYAANHQRGNSEHDLHELLSIAFDSAADRAARLRAGSLAMCVADDTDDRDLAQRLATALRITDIDAAESDADTVRLLLAYHVGFGDRSHAAEIALAITRWPDEALLRNDSIRSLSNAGFALSHCGKIPEATAALERAYALASKHAVPITEVTSCALRCWLARQVGDIEATSYWASLIRARAQYSGLQALNDWALWSLALVSLDNKDIDNAIRLADEIESRVKLASRSSHWAMLTGLRLRIAATSGSSAGESREIDDAITWSIRTAARQPDDDLALSLHAALQTLDLARAHSYLNAYLKLRRKELPILPLLSLQTD